MCKVLEFGPGGFRIYDARFHGSGVFWGLGLGDLIQYLKVPDSGSVHVFRATLWSIVASGFAVSEKGLWGGINVYPCGSLVST